MSAWKKPVIATSANISGSPILYTDEDALFHLSSVADFFLMHNRAIEIAQDDSVVKFTPAKQQRIVLRRSRGFAPTVTQEAFTRQTVLAMGADMKSAFTLQANGRVYTSQYLGDLESCESQQSFTTTLNHLLNLIQVKPELVLIDTHPNYFSSQAGRALATEWNVPVVTVQHHEAHAYSVLTENKLLKCAEPILNVVWDGTGYGSDGYSWGGEFFEYRNGALSRIGHMRYAPVWQGDTMARDARLSALFMGNRSARVKALLQPKFSDVVWKYYSKLTTTTPEMYTSSIGRLFDAVACLAGVSHFNSFEGESAMRLEALAKQEDTPARYNVRWVGTQLDTENLLEQVAMDVEGGMQPGRIAYKFHRYLAEVVRTVVEANGYRIVTLSGGVFQNALLVDLIIETLANAQVYVHQELSPNDESISFGQLASFVHRCKTRTETPAQELMLNIF
jgi:hydrogenase maturation protein HypF